MAYKIKDPSLKPKPRLGSDAPLVSGKDRILLFVEQNRSLVLAALLIVLMGGVALGGMLWWNQQQRYEALVLLGQAQKFYIDRPTDHPDQIERNLEQAITLFRQIVKTYPNTPSAELALYLLGNALYDKGDVKQAIQVYQRFIEDYGSDDILLGLVYQRLGMAYLKSGERTKGIETLSQVLALPAATNKDQVLYELGKVEESAGNTEQALAYYKELQNAFPYSPFASEVDLRVKMLEPKTDETKPSDTKEDPENTKEAPENTSEQEKTEGIVPAE
ncbi:MAG: outer membrane protein assembly factor BamD [Nitrospirae bacterium]|nr:MAG: outer membrane protein assembly factor BamD [Nitrospirota bacterium]